MIEITKPVQPEGGLTVLTTMRMCMYEEMVRLHGHKLDEFAIEDITDAINHLGVSSDVSIQLSKLIKESNQMPDEEGDE